MEPQELEEQIEKAGERSEKKIGLTMAIVAVALAIATMLGHRMHTEEVLVQTKANDQWAYYQAKNIRYHMYEADSKLASTATNGASLATQFKSDAEKQRTESEEVRKQAEELEQDTNKASREANQFDTAEIFLEVSIVLCSISLLTGTSGFWMTSFGSALVGFAFIARGFWVR